jgi:alpha-L-fucosidase
MGGRIARFDEAKFGMFVHWGAYAADGIEASWPLMLGPELTKRFVEALHLLGMGEVEMPVRDIGVEEYEQLPQRFRPEKFDAEEWVDLAKDAGQRYVVLTTKHHDGFAMFDTKVNDYGITHSPFGRDVTREVADACAAGGIGFGTYFSAPDVHDPGYRDLSRPMTETFLGQPERPEWSAFLDRMEAQVVELCTNYGELFSMWWDIGFGPQWPIDRFHGLVRSLQPQALMNDRLGGLASGVDPALAADFTTPEQSVPRAIPRRSTHVPTDPTMLFALIQRDDWEAAIAQIAPVIKAHLEARPDPTVPEPDDFLPWEACHTFGGAWAWAPELTEFKSGPDVIRNLVEVASRGGNLLMNVGPRGDGTIQPEFQEALRTVGRWLDRNGEGIYGTTFGPIQGLDGIRTTAGEADIYVHLLEAPPGGVVRLPLDAPVSSARLLGTDAPVGVTRDAGEVVLDVGRIPLDDAVTTIALSR